MVKFYHLSFFSVVEIKKKKKLEKSNLGEKGLVLPHGSTAGRSQQQELEGAENRESVHVSAQLTLSISYWIPLPREWSHLQLTNVVKTVS